MRRRSRHGLLLLAALAGLGRGCAAAPPPDAAAAAGELAEVALDRAELERLERLASDFYRRLENRRFNSIATFQDPGLREFFRTIESYSDYYAELAFALENADFEASRPTRVQVRAYTRDAALRVRVHVLFVGENAQPLRFWSTRLQRDDIWELGAEGRWWVIPGKV